MVIISVRIVFSIRLIYDEWAYGALTGELLDNYTHVFEITTNGPADYHRDAVRTWLEADGTRNYLLAGDEWLGADNNYTDQAYAAGTFEYDILGVTQSYNDVSYDGTSGQELSSEFFAREGSDLGRSSLSCVPGKRTNRHFSL